MSAGSRQWTRGQEPCGGEETALRTLRRRGDGERTENRQFMSLCQEKDVFGTKQKVVFLCQNDGCLYVFMFLGMLQWPFTSLQGGSLLRCRHPFFYCTCITHWSVPQINFVSVIHKHKIVICVSDAQICGPKIILHFA